MAVVSIQEIWRGRGGDFGADESTLTRVLRIWTNNGADDENVVMAALALPPWNIWPGAAHPNNSNAFCTGCRPNNDLGNRGWIAPVTYSTKKEMTQAPENDPIEISWDEEDIDVPVVKDRDGKAVLNSAGDPPDPPVMAPDSILIAKIELNAAAIPAYVKAYRKSINSDAFEIEGLLVNAKHARVRRMSLGKQKYRGSLPYRNISIELAITDNDEDDWEIRFLDAGYRRKVSDGGSPPAYTMEKIVNSDGTEPTAPVPLDTGQPIVDPTPDNVNFVEVGYYRLKPFIGNIPGCVAP